MICNQSVPQGVPTSHWGSYTEALASSVKLEPQSYGQYGGHYSAHAQPGSDDPLDTDLKDIKLEDLCYLNPEVNGYSFPDIASCSEQTRNSASPQSFCSSDLECSASPASSVAESWLSGGSDHVVPGASPRQATSYQPREERPLYVDVCPKPLPTLYTPQQQQPMHPSYHMQPHMQHYHHSRLVPVSVLIVCMSSVRILLLT